MKKKNIFAAAEFGDKFVTRGGRTALFIDWGADSHRRLMAVLRVEGELNDHIYDADGHCRLHGAEEFDIIAEYRAEVDEEKLDELSKNILIQNYDIPDSQGKHLNEYEQEIFKIGYRKSKNE